MMWRILAMVLLMLALGTGCVSVKCYSDADASDEVCNASDCENDEQSTR